MPPDLNQTPQSTHSGSLFLLSHSVNNTGPSPTRPWVTRGQDWNSLRQPPVWSVKSLIVPLSCTFSTKLGNRLHFVASQQ